MTKQEVLERFCKLSARVEEEHFGWSIPADCFCGVIDESQKANFQFSAEVMSFIETAVDSKLQEPQS